MTVAIIAALIAIIAVVSGILIQREITIEAGSIGSGELEDNSVISRKIVDGTIAIIDLSSEVLAEISGLQEIIDGTIIDKHISINANINPEKIKGTAWTADTDGPGSGLDSDTLDGIESSQFLRSDTSDKMNGDLTVNGDIFIKEKTRYYSVPYSAFRGLDDTTPYSLTGTALRNTDLSFLDHWYYASINLPHGAKVTQVTVNYSKEDVLADGLCYFINSENDGLATILFLNTSANNLTENMDVNVTIDNQNYSYSFIVYLNPHDDADDVKLRWIRITYKITEPLP
jgi:hypothetical protein